MKILLINYRYSEYGGPERYLFGLKKLLERRGHEVIPFSGKYSKNIPSEWENYFVSPIAGEDEITFKQHSWNLKSFVRALDRLFYSTEVYESLKKLIKKSRPDVAYVLLYLRKLSPSVLVAIKEAHLPLIVRLSDFFMLCPGGVFLRDKQPCKLCNHGRLWPSVYYRCVQGSLGASAVNALATIYHRYKGYFELIDGFITPTNFMKEEMIEGGWPEDKIYHVPTFVDLDLFKPNKGKRKQIISYTGRIHPTKGVDVLIDAFGIIQAKVEYKNLELMIAGDDKTADARELKNYIRKNGIKNIKFTGPLDGQGVARLLSSSLFSVIPSLWYDNMPNAALESMACGRPVVASDLGCFPEILGRDDTSVLFKVGNSEDLVDKISSLLCDPQRLQIMSKRTRIKAEREYNGEVHYRRLMNVFAKILQ